MSVVFYSTHCPKCRMLEIKLRQTGVDYSEVTDVDKMIEKGMTSAPALEVDGKMMNFKESMQWLSALSA